MTYDGTDPDDDGVVESDVDNQSTTTETLDTEKIGNAHVYADPDDDFQGVIDAHDKLPPEGGTIELMQGEYLAQPNDSFNDPLWRITKPLLLMGQGTASVLRLADSTDTDSGVRWIEVGDLEGTGGFDGTVDNRSAGTIFRDFKIDGDQQNNNAPYSNKEDGHNITVYADHFSMHNVHSINATGDGLEIWPDVKDVTVTGCHFRDNWEHHVHIHGGKHVTVTGNVMDGEVNNGMINFYAESGDISEDVVISGNTLRNGQNNAIQIGSGGGEVRNVRVVGNNIQNSAPNGVRIKLLSGNTAYDTPPNDITIADNTINGCGRGITVNTGDRIRIRDNDIYENDIDGILLFANRAVTDLKIRGNDIYDNGRNAPNAYGIQLNAKDFTVTRAIAKNNDIVVQDANAEHDQAVYAQAGTGSFSGGRIEGNFVRGSSGATEIFDSTNSFYLFENDGNDDALSSPPSNPAPGTKYLDDGTNHSSGAYGERVYDGNAWQDL